MGEDQALLRRLHGRDSERMGEDQALLQRLRRWDEEALAQVYDQHAAALYRYAYRLVGDQGVAQDIAAETFHRFLIALKNGSGPKHHLSAWLYRVAHNLVVDFYRRHPPQPALSVDEVEIAQPESHEEQFSQRQEAARVRQALQRLLPLQQQVVMLRFFDGLSNEEIAQVVERTVGAVKALQHRALVNLRQMLEVET